MCLAIPGKLTEIYQKDTLRMAKIDFGGIAKEICLEFVPEAELGDYALVHAGFAISLMNETEAQENIQLIQEVSRFDDEVS
ncbi:MAG: HypC/HybG/HupF family hydrogenase formation chaperone [Candidatus Electrothrix sp. GW3-4]|uniref:HypC/HybG/HupF family hydrogenase formation chaperone n=1 Tax=Candidatus Electrothrix sp. GW3-4 TaxID=3126740 RepID=UPI0030CB9CBF